MQSCKQSATADQIHHLGLRVIVARHGPLGLLERTPADGDGQTSRTAVAPAMHADQRAAASQTSPHRTTAGVTRSRPFEEIGGGRFVKAWREAGLAALMATTSVVSQIINKEIR